jgi:hypothetical protein
VDELIANWLRAAVDTIVARESAAGKKLPVDELLAFVRDTNHNPRARRLAFELVARVQPASAEKLLPGMLNDPSLELRRDAVQRVIGEAEQSLAGAAVGARRGPDPRRGGKAARTRRDRGLAEAVRFPHALESHRAV